MQCSHVCVLQMALAGSSRESVVCVQEGSSLGPELLKMARRASGLMCADCKTESKTRLGYFSYMPFVAPEQARELALSGCSIRKERTAGTVMGAIRQRGMRSVPKLRYANTPPNVVHLPQHSGK